MENVIRSDEILFQQFVLIIFIYICQRNEKSFKVATFFVSSLKRRRIERILSIYWSLERIVKWNWG